MSGQVAVRVVAADAPELIAAAAALVSEYAEYLARLFESPEEMRTYFADELADLERHYGPPDGGILLGMLDGAPVGVVVFRRLEDDVAEARWLYVRPEARGRGVARALMRTLVQDARAAGYSVLRLVTSERFDVALGLYERMGFRRIAPYRETAAAPLVSMELDLRDDLRGVRP